MDRDDGGQLRLFSLDQVQRLVISAILMTVGTLAAFIFPPSTRAASPYWSPVPLAGGGMSNLARYDPANGSYVLMGDDIGGIQYSRDGGKMKALPPGRGRYRRRSRESEEP